MASYCGECWQGRKDWLPDRPRPRRRKVHRTELEERRQQRLLQKAKAGSPCPDETDSVKEEAPSSSSEMPSQMVSFSMSAVKDAKDFSSTDFSSQDSGFLETASLACSYDSGFGEQKIWQTGEAAGGGGSVGSPEWGQHGDDWQEESPQAEGEISQVFLVGVFTIQSLSR